MFWAAGVPKSLEMRSEREQFHWGLKEKVIGPGPQNKEWEWGEGELSGAG